jgi:F-type H+-transporting ATPase subunit epsilon
MAEKFTFEVVSPERLLLSTQVDMAEIPAAEGDMGVLAGHSPMMVALRGGKIRTHENGQVTRTLFVGGGFAEVTPTSCTVLADDAVPVEELTKAAASARVSAAETAWEAAKNGTPEARDAALKRLLSARAMAEAATR